MDRENGGRKKKCSHCGWKNHVSEKCNYKNSECHKCHKLGHLASICTSNRVNAVHVSNLSLSSNNYVDTLNDNEDFSIYSVTGEHSAAPFTLKVQVDHAILNFVVDTGAACSLMSRETFTTYFKENVLKPCSAKLCAYSREVIQVVGEFIMVAHLF